MLNNIMKVIAKLKKDIEFKVHSDKSCIERELLINIHCQLGEIERKIDKGVNPQITNFYEEYPMDDVIVDNRGTAPLPYYMNAPKMNGRVRMPTPSPEYKNLTEETKEYILSKNIKKIPDYVPYELKIPTINEGGL